jgi:FkbM family methyltransferase
VEIAKLLRTAQAEFPFLLDAKFAVRSMVGRALKRPHDRDFRALALFPDVEGALYLDVGGNRGQSIEAILMFTERSCIWSFEPNPLLADKLTRRFGNERRVTIMDFGLGDREGVFTLFVPFYKRWMYDGLASLKREEAANWLRDRMVGYQERHLTIEEVDCRIRRLDDMLSAADQRGMAPFFIKLDAQGFELEVLRGGEETLRRDEPILLVESPDEETNDFLAGLAYRPYRYEDGQLKAGALGMTNTFFLTDRKAALLQANASHRRIG